MLTNVLFGQTSASSTDPLSVKATEGPARQQGNRSFSDHINDRPRQNETHSTSKRDSGAAPERPDDRQDRQAKPEGAGKARSKAGPDQAEARDETAEAGSNAESDAVTEATETELPGETAEYGAEEQTAEAPEVGDLAEVAKELVSVEAHLEGADPVATAVEADSVAGEDLPEPAVPGAKGDEVSTRDVGRATAEKGEGAPALKSAAQALTAALNEASQTSEAEAEIDVETVTQTASGKSAASVEAAAAATAGQASAATSAEPGRRAQGRARETLEAQVTSTENTTGSKSAASSNVTTAAQMSAVQQAFVAQSQDANVALAVRGDAPLMGGEFGGDSRGLSQILTEAALQPGTVHRPETPRQIGVQLASAFMAKGDRNVDIALNPEELGRVKMRVSTSETGITMVIQTERPETGDLMRRHINELADEFRKMGFDNISFEFSGEGAAAGGGMGDSEASAGGSQSGLGAEGEDLAMAEVAETAMQHLNLGNAGVDMRL